MELLTDAHGERVLCIDHQGATFSARHVAERLGDVGVWVKERTRPGDRVVLALPNGLEFFLCTMAVVSAGRVAVPVNSEMTKIEIDHVIATSAATLVISSLPEAAATGSASTGSTTSAAEIEPSVSPDDVAAIFFTSGTTGLPKGAELTHRGLLASVRRAAALPAGIRNDEVVFALPVAHIMGFSAMLGLLCAGIRVVVRNRFHPVEVLDVIETQRSSGFIGVPSMYRMMEEAGAAQRDLRCVRVWMSGADAMPPDLITTFQRYGASATLPLGISIGQALFVEGYGMVELSGGVATKITPPYAGKLLSRPIAIPTPGNHLRVVNDAGTEVGFGEVGELLVQGPGVFDGYRGDPGATKSVRTPNGWLRTGDLAKRGPLGVVELVGRTKNVIKVGGYSVFPAEIERVLERHPRIDEAVVVGLADPTKGQQVAAVIRLAPGSPEPTGVLSSTTLGEFKAHATEELTSYKVPVQWRIVSEFPRNGSGKVRRNELAQLFDQPKV